MAKWLSLCLRTKWLWVWITLRSLKLHIWCLLQARSSLTFRQTIECGFTMKLVREKIIRYSQMHHTDKHSQHSSIIWPVWLNAWVFVYKLSGCWFESHCSSSVCFKKKKKIQNCFVIFEWKAWSSDCCYVFLVVFAKIESPVDPLSVNPTKWSNTPKKFTGNFPTNCLSVFDHFVKLALKGLKSYIFFI